MLLLIPGAFRGPKKCYLSTEYKQKAGVPNTTRGGATWVLSNKYRTTGYRVGAWTGITPPIPPP